MATSPLSKTSLWQAWKDVRKLLRKSSRRDITDYFEFDVDPDRWLKDLASDIERGTYEPATPSRFSLAKSMGFSRRMTMPRVRDLVVYRAIVNQVLRYAAKSPGTHIHFARSALSKHRYLAEAEGYGYVSGNSFEEWLKFDQYRRYLLLGNIYPYIVLTDITNYFDSILFDRAIDAAMKSRMNSATLGLLKFMLERLSIRDSYGESPRIGLPVDEFECSRTLAHIVLFEHDSRMLRRVGNNGYARWMDDQAFGVSSRAEGLRVLKSCGDSLARLHLTPNVSKSQILSLNEARQHFHFDMNDDLDGIEEHLKQGNLKQARLDFASLWPRIRRSEQHGGEYAKVLKRVYRVAARVGAKYLRPRARRDTLKYASLAIRIRDYFAATGTAGQYLEFAEEIWSTPVQVYADINQVLAEGFLRIEADRSEARSIRKVAGELLQRKRQFPGWETCAALAPLLILRFGDKRSLRTLRALVGRLSGLHPAVGKAVSVVYASYGKEEYIEVVTAASKLQDNYLSDFLSMLDVALRYANVPKRLNVLKELSFDAVSRRKQVDMRRLLVLRLLRLNECPNSMNWLSGAQNVLLKKGVSAFDKALVKRMLKR